MDTLNIVDAHIAPKLTAVIMIYPTFFGTASKTEMPIKNAAREHIIKIT